MTDQLAGTPFIRRDEAGHEMRKHLTCPKCKTTWEAVAVAQEYLDNRTYGAREAFLKQCCNTERSTGVPWSPKCPTCYGRFQ